MKIWLKWLIGNDNKLLFKEIDCKYVLNLFVFFDWYIVCGFFFKFLYNGYIVLIIYIFIVFMIVVVD